MASSDDLVKYITERVVRYIDTPKQVRRATKAQHRQYREPWWFKWFGMLPLSLGLMVKGRKSKNSNSSDKS